MKRSELLRSEGYWTAKIQSALYREIVSFMVKTNRNKKQLADYLHCSKGYISQMLNGDFDHKISKLVALSLAIGKVPIIEYRDIESYVYDNDSSYSTSSVTGTSKYDKTPYSDTTLKRAA